MLDNDVLLEAVYVDLMYRVILINDQQKRRKKALVAIALSMKEHEERNSSANKVEKVK